VGGPSEPDQEKANFRVAGNSPKTAFFGCFDIFANG
jgi:hypothetical protein